MKVYRIEHSNESKLKEIANSILPFQSILFELSGDMRIFEKYLPWWKKPFVKRNYAFVGYVKFVREVKDSEIDWDPRNEKPRYCRELIKKIRETRPNIVVVGKAHRYIELI